MLKINRKQKSLISTIALAVMFYSGSCSAAPSPEPLKSPTNYTYIVANVYPHDSKAFTEGLVYNNGNLYEGTGELGHSSLRRVKLETGEILQRYDLDKVYFGEGITVYREKIIQLTWLSSLGFVYDKNTFQILREFPYENEAWGITNDGKRLIMSDGTDKLYFLDPETYKTTGVVDVRDGDKKITGLNELEYVDGRVYANIWCTDRIAIINPSDGKITGWIDLTGLLASQNYRGRTDILNGIAYDSKNNRLFVTGKYWPYLFEIKLVEALNN